MPNFVLLRYISFFLTSIIFFSIKLNAQVTPPAPYPSGIKMNYIRTWKATAPVQDPAVLVNRPLKDVKQTTLYFDGLGRLLQQVIKQGSLATGNSPLDMVSPVVYDALGREVHKYLPFAASGTSANDGNFKMDPFQQQASFGQAQYPGENYYYSQTEYEASPLNRIEKTFAAGDNWVGSNRGIEKKYWINTTIDDVKIWKVNEHTTGFADYEVVGTYPAGSLFKNLVIDEAGHQIIEFKDIDDKVILKKVQQQSTATDNGQGIGYTGFLCTYYIYDDNGDLRCVIQPRGIELICNDWLLNNVTILDEQCFRYEYDHRRRLTAKKVPGAGIVLMVYDIRDRLVFTQDANLRLHQQWLATLYDSQSRPVLTGLINYAGTREDLQDLVTAQTGGSQSGSNNIPADLVLSGTINSGSYHATNSIVVDSESESASDAVISMQLINPNSSSDEIPEIIKGVAVNRNPLPPGSDFDPLTFTYYDNYQWAASLPASLKDFQTSSINSHFHTPSDIQAPYPQEVAASTVTIGLVTGTKTRLLEAGSARYITSVNFYDQHSRPIQVRYQNSQGGYDAVTTQYNWSGQPLVVILQQQKPGGFVQAHTIVTKKTYDDLGRLSDVKKTVSSTFGNNTLEKPEQLILSNKYNAVGQLTNKSLANDLENLDYEYNIHGWLLGTNRTFVKGDQERYFGFELGYDKQPAIVTNTSYNTAQFNGNISGVTWRSAGDYERRKFDYSYDATNRLTSAVFTQYTGNGYGNPNGLNFSVDNLTYDANGNIKSMQQYGWKIGQAGALIDNLTYNYNTSSNKLKNVVDASNDPDTRLGDFRSSRIYMDELGSKTNAAFDYDYDANGNLTKDLNKDIGSTTTEGITYNILNLPETITVRKSNGLKGTIRYLYDAIGVKHRKIVEEQGQVPKTTLYINNVVYENDTLRFINHEEGRLRYDLHYFSNNDQAWEYNYDYFLKDHLGNVRMVLTEQKDTAIYVATMESDYRTKEELLFSNIGTTAYLTPNYYPTDIDVTDPNNYVARLDGTSGKKIGPSLILKVMSGDEVMLSVKSFYRTATRGADNLPVEEIAMALAGTLVSTVGPGKGTVEQISDLSPLNGGIGLFRNNNQEDNPSKPKAYLNWILFDEQFNYIAGSSGASSVGPAGQLYQHPPASVTMNANGYLYVYTSTETQNWEVLFNDLIVHHRTGRIMEETHYYPFGLTMTGISSKALDPRIRNRYKFNGNEEQTEEFSDGNGLEFYDFNARNYNAQTGRFMQPDPLNDRLGQESLTPFHSFMNNPILRKDPTGMFAPIYDQAGTFLGTDNEGWHGKAIVLDRSVFFQGMSHEDALLLNLGEAGLLEGAYAKLESHWQGIQEWLKLPQKESNNGFGLGLSLTSFGVGVYNDYMHNHKTYTTTGGESRNIYKKPGEYRSARAGGFGRLSKFVKGASIVGGLVSTGYSGYKVVNQIREGGIENINTLDATDVGVGATGLISTGMVAFGLLSNPVGWIIGAGVTIYFGARLVYDLYQEYKE